MRSAMKSAMKITPILAVLLLSSSIHAKDLFIVGQEYPPFNWTEGGAIKGGMLEVMQAACDKLRYHCTFALVPLPRAMEMLEEGRADAVMSLVPTPDRARYAYFSPTIVTSSLSYLGIKGKVQKVDKLSALDGWTFGTVRGSASFKMAVEHQKQAKGMNLIEENSNATVVKKLQGGRYGDKGAIVGGDAVLSYEARKINLELEQMLVGQVQSFVTAFSKKSVDEPTRADLTRVLEAMKKSGEMQSILQKFSLKTD